jgi:hypothetical protein
LPRESLPSKSAADDAAVTTAYGPMPRDSSSLRITIELSVDRIVFAMKFLQLQCLTDTLLCKNIMLDRTLRSV